MDERMMKTCVEPSKPVPHMEKDLLPLGYEELKGAENVFISQHEIVVTGEPDEEDENHNCDEMGCSSISHVIFRANI